MNQKTEIDRHIDILDGIRVIAIVFIVWYHLWQQSWATPYILFDNSITKYLGITTIPLHLFVRFASVFVDVLILISAICNLYPYAWAIIFQEKWPDTKQFYLKRMIRIFPSYYLNILIELIFAFAQHKYDNTAFMFKDIITHLTFTSVLFSDTYLDSRINGVLWAVQVEVIFYLLIPFLAKAFKKSPWITCLALWGCSIISSNYFRYQKADSIRAWSNYFLVYAGFYASGMLICMCYLTIKSKGAENKYTRILAVLVAIGCVGGVIQLLEEYFNNYDVPTAQLITRFQMMIIYSVFIIAMMFVGKGIQKLFCNKLFRFLNIISYNLYIWHQVVAFKCIEFKIPGWEGDTLPNVAGDVVWQRQYSVIVIVLSIIIATVLTYWFELPIARYLRKRINAE